MYIVATTFGKLVFVWFSHSSLYFIIEIEPYVYIPTTYIYVIHNSQMFVIIHTSRKSYNIIKLNYSSLLGGALLPEEYVSIYL